MLGIERLTPDNVDLEDEAVWKSIRDDTTLIFQWESDSAQAYIKKFMSDQTLSIVREKIPNFSMEKWLTFGNGLIRPSCASFRDNVAKGEFYDNGFKELNDFLAPEAGRIAMQETIMRFLVKFCGYTDAESDNVRRAVAKKKGTAKLLPEIERRFIEYAPAHYDITPERCAEVIKPFIKIIDDASAYGFSWNHSEPYSILGYVCGYLRYYHPLEFLTAALNIFGDNMTKTAAITSYANKVGVRVMPPKFGLSRSGYVCDRERNVIAKGLTSVKFMNAQIADELYTLARQKTYTSFMDLLSDIETQTSLNSRQLDILIKIDFFSDFGNQRELLRMTDLFAGLYNHGAAKQIKKSAVAGSPLEPIIRRYAVGTTKSGGEAKSYTLLDVPSILRETEDAIRALHMEDLNDTVKIRNFHDVMGYVGYVSGAERDRRKLYITGVRPLRRKADGKTWAYSVFTKSVGSGKESRFTLLKSIYDKSPIHEGDLIYCRRFARDGAYFRLVEYDRTV